MIQKTMTMMIMIRKMSMQADCACDTSQLSLDRLVQSITA
jgi:hypothetical protein